jgi:LPS sulfotransferase NodH
MVRCDDELLAPLAHSAFHRLIAPRLFSRGLPIRQTRPVYGFDLKTDQILQVIVSRRQSAVDYVEWLYHQGWKVLHLRRENVFRQAISNLIAHQRQKWKAHMSDDLGNIRYSIDPRELTNQMTWNLTIWNIEDQITDRIPHLRLFYEKDLLQNESRQAALDRAFQFIGVKSHPVKTSLQRLGKDRLEEQIENYTEVVEAVRRAGFGKYLED